MDFGQKNKDQRKFQCFVCGIIHDDFNEFTAHIIDSHEEGRDYVICPLQRCQCPVRDTRSHFKAKHPTEKVPPKGQLKAIIWRDIASNGKIKTRKPKFREGYYESIKMGKSFYYRSGYEANVYEMLDAWNEVIAYEAEPFKIPYIHEGECHNYIPDIFVAFLDGHKEIWEIKPENQTNNQKNIDKWFSARKACEARGWKFEIITETVMNKLKIKIKNQHLFETDQDA